MTKFTDYAIADVHGRADLLLPLVLRCLEDALNSGTYPRFTFLGDIIDRGHRSRECLDIVADVLSTHEGSVCLRGNHEDLALDALTAENPDKTKVDRWLCVGGMSTLESYCSDPETGFEMMRTLNRDHLRMMENSQLSITRGNFKLAHAGVDPTKPFSKQSADDLMWSGSEFLDHVGELEQVIIHGHSIVGNQPIITENRVSIDTGAYRSGRLTACVIEEAGLRFLQTDGSGRRIIEVEPIRLDRGHSTCLGQEYARAA